MKIQSAWSNYVDGHGQSESYFQVFGLGVDGKVYKWNDVDGVWELNVRSKTIAERQAEVNPDDELINLDDIPF